MATTKQRPQFIKVGGQIYQLETAAGDAAGRDAPVDEPIKQNARDFEQYLSGKGSEKIDSGKEKKETEKSLTLSPASDKENAANIPDKMTSPDKDFYTGKETKRDLKSFELKPGTEKEYEGNNPQKLPAKIKVKGTVYELVSDHDDTQDGLPNLIKVKGEVYERVIPPPFLRVNGKTFVKLGHAEALEVLAKKGGKKQWKKYLDTLTDKAKHSVSKCIRELKGSDWLDDPKDPGAFCSWAKDQAEGDTEWRKGPRSKKKDTGKKGPAKGKAKGKKAELERTALQYKKFIPEDMKLQQRERDLQLQEEYLRRKKPGNRPSPSSRAPVGPSSQAPAQSGMALLVVKLDNDMQEEATRKIVKALTLAGGQLLDLSCNTGDTHTFCTIKYSATRATAADVKHFMDRVFTDVLHLPEGTWLFDRP